MRRLLLALPLAAAIGLLGVPRALSRPDDDFGVLKTAPARPAGDTLPAGVEPSRSAPRPAAPANPYPITADAGPWVICAASYVGPDGDTLSRQVCEDLRKRRLPAYIFNRGEEERRKAAKEWDERVKMYPPEVRAQLKRRTVRIPDQFAVLVGGFKDFAHASSYLPKLKALPAPELKLDSGRSAYDEAMLYDKDAKGQKGTSVRKVPLHPYHAAMVVHNPAAPSAPANRPKWDPFWKTLNEGEDYSLLNNPKPWTLLVKEYMGGRVMQQQSKSNSGFLSALGLGSSKGEALEGAALQARELAKFLSNPRFGFKTYVLHTRYSSIVTVGGFSGPDDPELARLQRQLQSLKFSTQQGGADPIGLMAQPVPIEVPRF